MAKPRRPYHYQQKEEPKFRVGRQIRAKSLRVVGENIAEGNKVLTLEDALNLAQELELDLVEISPTADPPVCKIVDYQKFLYEEKKRLKKIKSNTTKVEVKEIRFTPNTDDHDFDFKLKHAEKFLSAGNKVKAFVFFKGRSIVYKDQGQILLLKMAERLEEFGTVEQMPKLEGRRMTMILSPKAKKK
ncbi:MAG: translation initiation factor IF-3 [Bacteroidales bacterium]|nr:translation initiation factor IF-3 [Bacteroidales bacterium]